MTRKKYVVYENTLSEVFRIADEKRDPNSSKIELYKYVNDIEMDERQKLVQLQSSWKSHIDLDLTLYDADLEEEVKKTMFDMVLSKSKENIEKATFDKMMGTKISACIEIVDIDSGRQRVDRSIEMEYIKTKGRNENVEYVHDTKEMEDRIRTVKMSRTFSGQDNEFVYISDVSVGIYEYRLDRMKEIIPKIIKKVIRNNLAYCLKKGVCIVPDEYLDKGMAGVEEWKEMKSSANKNNSMEKRIAKQLLHDKKDFAVDCVCTATRLIADANPSWTIPALEVDGRYNKQRVKKLVNQLLKDKNDQGILSMSNEEIVSLCKEYWKGILMDAYNVVDQMKMEGR